MNTARTRRRDIARTRLRPPACAALAMLALLISLTTLAPTSAHAQLLAFPGAEGAGAHAVGGRGGDVYWVTNLNDTGEGSLRHGVDSAAGPRTILFAVSGTIELQTDLRINNPYLTIAGQSAPGGGITLANRQTVVDSTHDVIVQHIRFRPGDTFANGYEPDSLWVRNANNVVVDHVSASWGIDEVLSVTHGSYNVSVQWSMINQALHNAGHASQGNHGFGSLINGGDITFHHNLYADNRSRNPRPQQTNVDGLYTRLDFVNNVIHNPGDRFGYSGNDALDLNWVANWASDGPNSQPPNSVYYADSTSTRIYFDGNFRNGAPVGLGQVSGTYTLLNQRADLPEVHTTNARRAYIDVLSHVGAGGAAGRDSLDRQAVRSVMLGTGNHIDSQSEVGGWPDLGHATANTYADGIPDWWKLTHGLDVNQQYHQTDAGDGYTYLEHYLHSLTADQRPHYDTMPMVISTAFGRGADVEVSENVPANGSTAISGSNTTGPALNARWAGPDGERNEYILLRFDLADVITGSVADAALQLTAFRDMQNFNLRVYGLEHHVADQLWDENTITFDTAPALHFDGDAGTRGLIASDALLLGTFSTGGALEGDLIHFDDPNLAVFLNLLMERDPDADDAALVTLLIERVNNSTGQSRFASSRATHLQSGNEGDFAAGTAAPMLILDAALVPEPTTGVLLGLAVAALLLRPRPRSTTRLAHEAAGT